MIEIGEYGRTNLGNIIKFAWFQDENGITYKDKVILVDEMIKNTKPYYYFKKNEFIKNHSKNIIDLIEVGDYVNEGKVLDICECEYGGEKVIHIGGFCLPKRIYDNEIKSIVTKEQFANVEYRLEENK